MYIYLYSLLQQLQPSRNLVHQALRRRSNAQHRHAASLDLRPARVLDHLGREPHCASLASQLQHFGLALDLNGDLGLAEALPAGEQLAFGGCRVGAGKGLVAGERGVRALSSDFACDRMSE